ncbi:serine/threonine-protein kinase [Neomicrococcus aestuarii]|uniref:non-specific serine/threonine protein kinase n=1 Tax=Neomicrococcus aestuarii TaxID=556325 RepID=A0A7W8WXZ3_9MICC|nr:Stk1 family PASTA domain-containing Ser/Thr kinase [Neomicrococcus aestuarii]MBB5511776.1 serine/threonine-protein kinase [Neomicrococcus aestuarii]
MEERTVDPLVGQVIDRRYHIHRRLARGGMSTVYLATDERLHRDVALKALYPYLAEDARVVKRFEEEAITAAKLSHPNIVNVLDQGVDGDTAYLVMEYVKGETLRKLLERQGRLTPRQTLRIMEEILDGLAAAHAKGLIHRDVKPENVLLTETGRVKVADFGLARAASNHTQSGTLVGTVAYVSPELVTGGNADKRSDLYAIGIMLFELLTGEQPFQGQNSMQIVFKHVNETVPLPSTVVPEIPQDLDELVEWCTAKDPEARPVDAEALLGELRHVRAALSDEQLDLGATEIANRRKDYDDAAAATAPVAVDREVEEKYAGYWNEPDQSQNGEPGASTAANSSSNSTPDGDSYDTDPTLDDPDQLEDRDDDGDFSSDVDEDEDLDATTVIATGDHRTEVFSRVGSGYDAREDSQFTEVINARDLSANEATSGVETSARADGGTSDTGVISAVGATAPPARPVKPAVAAKQARKDAKNAEHEWKKQAQKPLVKLDKKGAGVRRWILAIVLFMLAALLAATGWFFGMGPGAPVSLPETSGQTVASATQALSDAGVAARPKEVFSDDVDKGLVVGTEPLASTTIRRYEGVDLLVSKGPELFEVPNLAQLAQSDLPAILEAESLELGTVTQEFDESIAKGEVLSQSVAPGTAVRRGTEVSVVVSKGPAPVSVPGLAGMTLAEATAALENIGLNLVEGQEENSASVPAGQISAQSVKEGTKVSRGTDVSVSISLGPRMIEVPRVIGMQLDEARSTLEDLGFEVSVKYPLGNLFGTVHGQSVLGDTAAEGSTITLTVV